MKFSTLAVALFASTTLVSVTSTAVNGGVRGSIDQDQAQTLPEMGSNRRVLGMALYGGGKFCRRKNCVGCWMPNADGQGTDKCQEYGIFGGTTPLTETDCGNIKSYFAPQAVWCADIDYDALDGLPPPPLRYFDGMTVTSP